MHFLKPTLSVTLPLCKTGFSSISTNRAYVIARYKLPTLRLINLIANCQFHVSVISTVLTSPYCVQD